MSNALILTAITAVLKHLLENGLVHSGVTANVGADVTVSALPPDRIKTGDDERPQLNVFLYQVTPKGLGAPSRYRNETERDPEMDSDTDPKTDPNSPEGRSDVTSLELSYLLTAYGAQDFQIEALLGYGLELLLTHSALSNRAIREILASVASMEGGRVVLPALTALSAPDLAARILQIKVCPQNLPGEEVSKLWSILQTRYRPSIPCKVTVTVSRRPVSAGVVA